MADCSKTEVFFKELDRMCRSIDGLKTNECPLRVKFISPNCDFCDKYVIDNITLYDKKAIEIVQKWSDEHPLKTRQSEFLKQFPRSRVTADGTLDLLPCSVDTELKDRCDEFVGCYSCGRAYWLEEVD